MDFNNYYGGVYITTNKINGMFYIGKVVFGRKNDWEKYLGSGVYLKRAIRKYGKENFDKVIVAVANNETELRKKEEEFIKIYDAVKNPDCYNIKETSIGGDVFTNHPEKERLREQKRKQMLGENNHQYGKPKTQKMIDSVKKANSKPIYCDGLYFVSASEASRLTGIKHTTILYRVNSKNFPNYQYHA